MFHSNSYLPLADKTLYEAYDKTNSKTILFSPYKPNFAFPFGDSSKVPYLALLAMFTTITIGIGLRPKSAMASDFVLVSIKPKPTYASTLLAKTTQTIGVSISL